MGSHENALPAIKTKPKIIFFTDFDGTITLKDSMFFRPSHDLFCADTYSTAGNDYMVCESIFEKPLRFRGVERAIHI